MEIVIFVVVVHYYDHFFIGCSLYNYFLFLVNFSMYVLQTMFIWHAAITVKEPTDGQPDRQTDIQTYSCLNTTANNWSFRGQSERQIRTNHTL